MRLRACLFALSMVAISASAAAEDMPVVAPDIGQKIAANFAEPAARDFAEHSAALHKAMSTLCETPGNDAFLTARDAFAETLQAWGRISVLRFGPVSAQNRFERLYFWPDPRGVILRQTGALLAEAETLPDGGIAEMSVAVQGFPALEYALYGKASETLESGAPERCQMAAAMAKNIAEIAGTIKSAWSPGAAFRKDFVRPGAQNVLYRSPEEVAGEVVKATATTLQFTRNAELLPPLGTSSEKARGSRAPFWRSGLTFGFIAARLEGTELLLRAAGFETADASAVKETTRNILFDIRHVREALSSIKPPPREAFADAEARSKILYATFALEEARARNSQELAAALGLIMGFNALDGD